MNNNKYTVDIEDHNEIEPETMKKGKPQLFRLQPAKLGNIEKQEE
jgi:hypothetical protein